MGDKSFSHLNFSRHEAKDLKRIVDREFVNYATATHPSVRKRVTRCCFIRDVIDRNIRVQISHLLRSLFR